MPMADADEKLPHVPRASMLQPNMFGCSQVMGSQSDYMVPSQQVTTLESTQDAEMSQLIGSISDSDLDITETGNCFNKSKHGIDPQCKQHQEEQNTHWMSYDRVDTRMKEGETIE